MDYYKMVIHHEEMDIYNFLEDDIYFGFAPKRNLMEMGGDVAIVDMADIHIPTRSQ